MWLLSFQMKRVEVDSHVAWFQEDRVTFEFIDTNGLETLIKNEMFPFHFTTKKDRASYHPMPDTIQ